MKDALISRANTEELLRAYANTITYDSIRAELAPKIRIGINMAADFIKDPKEVPTVKEIENENTKSLRKCKGRFEIYKDNRWRKVDFELGYFHQWGMNYDEIDDNVGTYSVAIVELPDGRVVMPAANEIVFLNN